MSLIITADKQPRGADWQAWVEGNDLTDCVQLIARNEALTAWTGEFLQRDDTGRIVLDEDRSSFVTAYRYITTTPALPGWVRVL
jgi:hypothetical protein